MTSAVEVAGPRDAVIGGLRFSDVDATVDDGCVFSSVAVIFPLSSGTGTPGAVDEAAAVINIVDEPEVRIESGSGGDGEGIDNDEGVRYDRLRFEICVVLEGRTWKTSIKFDCKLTTAVVNSEAVFTRIENGETDESDGLDFKEIVEGVDTNDGVTYDRLIFEPDIVLGWRI